MILIICSIYLHTFNEKKLLDVGNITFIFIIKIINSYFIIDQACGPVSFAVKIYRRKKMDFTSVSTRFVHIIKKKIFITHTRLFIFSLFNQYGQTHYNSKND